MSTRPREAIFESLEREWRLVARHPESVARLARWSVSEPALSGCVTFADVLARTGWDGFQATAQCRATLTALLRLAGDPVAARCLLQALLPRARAERVAVARYGHLAGLRQLPAETTADLVGECFAAVKRHAGEERADVARTIVQEATRKLRTARQAQRRYEERTALSHSLDNLGPPTGLHCARTRAEWLAHALCQAVSTGGLGTADARLLFATRVRGVPASEAGRTFGLQPKAVYHALARAERLFVGRVA